MKTQKSAFGGWYLYSIVLRFMVIFAEKTDLDTVNMIRVNIINSLHYDNSGFVWRKGMIYNDQKEYENAKFTTLLDLLNEIYNMPNVNINFKNTLLVLKKQWETKVV